MLLLAENSAPIYTPDMSKKSIGHFLSHGLKLEPHELLTIQFFLDLNYDIELILPSSSPYQKRPDFYMRNTAWESKSPILGTRTPIRRLFFRAVQQSENLIFDLRRLKSNELIAQKTLLQLFTKSRQIKNLLIITQDGTLLEFHK